jgi:hypothetical protein
MQQFMAPLPGLPISFGERTLGAGKYAAGSVDWQDWNRAPIGPSLGRHFRGFGASRTGDTLALRVAPFSHHEAEHVIDGWSGSTTLSQGGATIGTSAYAGWANFDVPAAAATYTLEVTGKRNTRAPLGTSLAATWTFASARGEDAAAPQALPLLVVRVGAAVDGFNRALAGIPFLLTLEVERPAGAPAAAITELGLDVSYDDGATWTSVPVVHLGGRGLALLLHPATPGFVSLRARARDEAGSRVVHAVTRSYRTAVLP